MWAFMLLLLIPAPQYGAHRVGETVVLEDVKNQTSVSILPGVGNIAFSMKVKGQDILRWPYASIERDATRVTRQPCDGKGP
jgi:hypothetical protein